MYNVCLVKALTMYTSSISRAVSPEKGMESLYVGFYALTFKGASAK